MELKYIVQLWTALIHFLIKTTMIFTALWPALPSHNFPMYTANIKQKEKNCFDNLQIWVPALKKYCNAIRNYQQGIEDIV